MNPIGIYIYIYIHMQIMGHSGRCLCILLKRKCLHAKFPRLGGFFLEGRLWRKLLGHVANIIQQLGGLLEDVHIQPI